jgi:hypothetical protein
MQMRARTAVISLVAGLALTACGPGNPPPVPEDQPTTTPTPTPIVEPDIYLDKAIKMTLDAPSKRIVGKADAGGHGVEFDITYVGDTAKGTKISTAPGISMTTEFIRVGPDLFIYANEHYWQTHYNLEVLKYLVNKWVRVAADDANYSELLVLDVNEQAEPMGTVTQVGTDTVNGTPVVVFTDSRDFKFYVAAQGEPYLLRFEGSQTSPVGLATVTVTFSEFGTVSTTIAAPAGPIFNPETDFPEIAVGRD